MRLNGVYPFLDAYHTSISCLDDDEIEELAQRAWMDGAEPQAVLRRDDGTWVAWRALESTLEPDLRAGILAQVPYRATSRTSLR